jgi:glucosylceramidase
MSNQSSRTIVETVMADAGARGYVKGIGLQWAQRQFAGQYANNYDVPVMQTEHQCGNFPNGNNTAQAPNDHAYGLESWGLIRDWIDQGVQYYLAWNMVLNPQGHNIDTQRLWAQNALLVVDEQAGQLNYTPTYFVFRHVAQYVDPDSQRVGVQGGDALAWKNPDGDIVVAMHNSGGGPSQETVAIGGSTYAVTVPGQGWATVNWQAPE